jgi:hypothetical protein
VRNHGYYSLFLVFLRRRVRSGIAIGDRIGRAQYLDEVVADLVGPAIDQTRRIVYLRIN